MQLVPDYPIETDRLRLRPFTRGDVDAVFAYRSREDVTRFMVDGPMSREACAEAVQARIGQTVWIGEGDKLQLAIERRADAVMIGEVVLTLRSAESLQAEIGYLVHPDHQRLGFATEAARAVVALGFAAGIHRTYARCHVGNVASRRVMERLGMRQEAHFRGHALVKGVWDEEYHFAILAGEWDAAGG